MGLSQKVTKTFGDRPMWWSPYVSYSKDDGGISSQPVFGAAPYLLNEVTACRDPGQNAGCSAIVLRFTFYVLSFAFCFFALASYVLRITFYFFSSSSNTGKYFTASPNARMPAEKMPMEISTSGRDGK